MTRTPDIDKSPTPPHSRLHSARLVRLLRELAGVDASAPAGDFAEHLSRWLGVADAIALHAVLHRAPFTSTGEMSSQSDAIAADIAREREALQQMIADACTPQGFGRIRFPAPALVMAGTASVAYQPLLIFHRSVQRELEQRIVRQRVRVRALLAPAVSALVALDEAMDRALAPRESDLFAEIPTLLERRFTRLHDQHRESLAGATDDAATWLQPGGWLARFRDDVHDMLQAELELRLQPVLGLAAASHQELASVHE